MKQKLHIIIKSP